MNDQNKQYIKSGRTSGDQKPGNLGSKYKFQFGTEELSVNAPLSGVKASGEEDATEPLSERRRYRFQPAEEAKTSPLRQESTPDSPPKKRHHWFIWPLAGGMVVVLVIIGVLLAGKQRTAARPETHMYAEQTSDTAQTIVDDDNDADDERIDIDVEVRHEIQPMIDKTVPEAEAVESVHENESDIQAMQTDPEAEFVSVHPMLIGKWDSYEEDGYGPIYWVEINGNASILLYERAYPYLYRYEGSFETVQHNGDGSLLLELNLIRTIMVDDVESDEYTSFHCRAYVDVRYNGTNDDSEYGTLLSWSYCDGDILPEFGTEDYTFIKSGYQFYYEAEWAASEISEDEALSIAYGYWGIYPGYVDEETGNPITAYIAEEVTYNERSCYKVFLHWLVIDHYSNIDWIYIDKETGECYAEYK